MSRGGLISVFPHLRPTRLHGSTRALAPFLFGHGGGSRRAAPFAAPTSHLGEICQHLRRQFLYGPHIPSIRDPIGKSKSTIHQFRGWRTRGGHGYFKYEARHSNQPHNDLPRQNLTIRMQIRRFTRFHMLRCRLALNSERETIARPLKRLRGL